MNSPSFVSKFVPGSVTAALALGVEVKKSARNDGSTYTVPWDVAKLLYPEVKPYIGWGQSEDLFGSAPLLECLLGEHMLSYKPWIMEWARKALIRMRKEKKGASIYTGDADFWLTILEDSSEKTIFKLTNSCTCSANNGWVIIYEHNDTEETVHVRAAWDVRGKEAKKQVFDDGKPTFAYFKKTKYDTPYEDMRDPGFVCTHKIYKGALAGLSTMEEGPDKLGHFYNDWRHAMYNLWCISLDFDGEPEKA
jgi:hypothetical protein